MKTWILGALGALACASTATMVSAQPSGNDAESEPLSVNWYHGREFLFPIVYQFERETGIDVEITDAYDRFDTDVILASDYVTLNRAASEGRLAQIGTPERDARVPSIWRDDEGHWYGVSVRLRAVVYNPDVIAAGEITSIYDLADPRYEGRICLRSSQNEYNRTMLATMIAEEGDARAREWAERVRDNAGGEEITYRDDISNVMRIASGECDVSFINTYYLGYMQEGKIAGRYNFTTDNMVAFYAAVQQVEIAWLDQEGRGNFANVTAVGINSETSRRADAERFVDFLLSDRGQELLVENVFKYPTVPGIGWSDFLLSQGRPRMRDTDLNSLDSYYPIADEIYQSAGWE